MATAAVHITRLPPGPIRSDLHFDQHRFIRPNTPVSADFHADGVISSPGISFEDYTRMGTVQRKLAGGNRLEAPAFVFNNSLLRKVLVRYIESRAGFQKPTPGTEEQRLTRAQQVISSWRPARIATLTALSKELVALNQSCPLSDSEKERKYRVTVQIQNLDTVLRLDKDVAAIVLGIVYGFYRRGLDSVAVATELGIKPPHVRQTLWRLRRTFDRMNGIERPATKHCGPQRPGRRATFRPEPKPIPHLVAKHLAILEKLAANNGGKLPTYSWLNNNGFFRSYEVMRTNPSAFKHLQRAFC